MYTNLLCSFSHCNTVFPFFDISKETTRFCRPGRHWLRQCALPALQTAATPRTASISLRAFVAARTRGRVSPRRELRSRRDRPSWRRWLPVAAGGCTIVDRRHTKNTRTNLIKARFLARVSFEKGLFFSHVASRHVPKTDELWN